MVTSSGEVEIVESIEYVKEKIEVYNMHVLNTENYYAENILVHNKGCFLGGTEIITGEGKKDIEDILVGELVMSFDEGTGEFEMSKVVETFEHKEDMYLIINKNLQVTPNHPMWLNGEWQEIASRL